METWQKSLAQSITTPEELANRFPCDIERLGAVVQRYPMRITPHYLSLMEGPGDPIWQQCVPDPRELTHDELLQLEGHGDKLTGLVQERYALTRDAAVQQVKHFYAKYLS